MNQPFRLLLRGGMVFAFVVIVGCGDGGSAEPAATPTPDVRIVVSDDGNLTLEIPLGAVAEDVELTISQVPFDEMPEELRVVRGAGDGYLLEPEGLVFNEPVAVSLELSLAELEGNSEDGIAAYALVTLSADKVRTILEGQSTEWTRGDDSVIVRGQLRHFSVITRTLSSLTVDLEQVPREQVVGGSFTVQAAAGNTDQSGLVTLSSVIGRYFTIGGVLSIEEGETSLSGTSLAPGQFEQGTAVFKCDSPGVALYGVRVLALSLVEGSPEGTQLELTVDSDVVCAAGTPTPTPNGPPITLGAPTTRVEASTSTPLPEPPPTPSGGTAEVYSIEVALNIESDPGGHAEFIDMPDNIKLTVTIDETGHLTISGPSPWVRVEDPNPDTLLKPLPAPDVFGLSATGMGTVAVFESIAVSFTGTFDPESASGQFLTGFYSMGIQAGGANTLPGVLPIEFRIKPVPQ